MEEIETNMLVHNTFQLEKASLVPCGRHIKIESPHCILHFIWIADSTTFTALSMLSHPMMAFEIYKLFLSIYKDGQFNFYAMSKKYLLSNFFSISLYSNPMLMLIFLVMESSMTINLM